MHLDFLYPKGGPLGKKCFIEAPETHPDILQGGHRNPYQLENTIKSGGIVFCNLKSIFDQWSKLKIDSLGLNNLPGSCVG